MRIKKGDSLFICILLMSFSFSSLGFTQTLKKEKDLKSGGGEWFFAPFKTHRYSIEPSLTSQVGSLDAAGSVIGVGAKLRSLFNYRSYFGGLEYSYQTLSVSGASSNANFPLSSHTGSRDTLSAIFGLFTMNGKLRLHGSLHLLNKMKVSSVSYRATVEHIYYKDDNTTRTEYPLDEVVSEDTVFVGSGYEVGLTFNLIKRLSLTVGLSRFNYKGGMGLTKEQTVYNNALSEDKYKQGILKKTNTLPKELNVTSLSIGVSSPFYFTFLSD